LKDEVNKMQPTNLEELEKSIRKAWNELRNNK